MLRAFGLLVLVLVAGGGAAGWLLWQDFEAHRQAAIGIGDEPVAFTVERGWSARRTGEALEAAGIIDNARWFDLDARLGGRGADIKAGEFTLEPGTSVAELLPLFAAGRTRQYRHTIVEGSTFVEVLNGLANAPRLEPTLVAQTGGNAGEGGAAGDDETIDWAAVDAERLRTGESVMAALERAGVHPEGRFFADTYAYPAGTTDVQFLARAARRLDAVLAEEWEARAEGLPLETPEEALILASIVEKETAAPEERPRIAGVFLSRMVKGMRLQTDPTVIYGIGAAYDGDIRRRDLLTDTPYNTYTRGGLPPTPIAMVGREAIRATLHPEETTALYFVSRGDGTHVFSETLAEHEAAVRKYQLGQ